MRFYFLLFPLLFFGCKKNTNSNKSEAPKCKLTNINRADYDYPLTYEGARLIKVGSEAGYGYGYRLYYDNSGRLTTAESPLIKPDSRLELYYNDEGKISMEKHYEMYLGNWREGNLYFYTYTNGKLTGIRETAQWATPALEFNSEVTWQGDNISSIVTRSGSTVVCTKQYSYDLTQKNPLTALSNLYYCDYLGPSFKQALYFSANRLIKEEPNCGSLQTTNITYEFRDTLLQRIYTNGYPMITYTYQCL